MADRIQFLFMYFPIFLLSLTIHEFCHGFVAYKKGDPTAKFMGRLTLNPLPHIDPIGTVVFPIFSILFGGIYFAWAKPVPVNPAHFKHRVSDMFWVALAGPASNFALAFFSAWIYGMTVQYGHRWMDATMVQIVIDLSRMSLYLNLALCFFNLIPLAPLDGSKIIGRLLPDSLRSSIEQINPMVGSMILFALFVSGILRYIAIPIYIAAHFLERLFMW